MSRGLLSLALTVCVFAGCGDDEGTTSVDQDAALGGGGAIPTDGGGMLFEAGPVDDGGVAPRGDVGDDDDSAVEMADAAPSPPDAQVGDAAEPADGSEDSGAPPSVFSGEDGDGDGLDDGWEMWAGDPDLLSPESADTDGDGTRDADEDHDGDGLTALEEQRAGAYAGRVPADEGPHPFRPDVLVEVDAMTDHGISVSVLEAVSELFGVVQRAFFVDRPGVGVYFFADEDDVPVEILGAAFDPRQDLLENHGPTFDLEANLPYEQMIHMVIATRRDDLPGRAGEVVTHADNPRRTGVIIYADAIAELFPMCGLDDPPPIPHVTYDEAMVGTVAHELGHVLQLGHDTDRNGGVNHFNVMSVPARCPDIRRHFLGEGNDDPARGATEDEGLPRLSVDAAALIRLDSKLSVDTSQLLDGGDGFEM